MANRGIGIQGVTSQIGVMKAFGKIYASKKYQIQRTDLRDGLCYRFNATKDEADDVIDSTVKVGLINIVNNIITIKR